MAETQIYDFATVFDSKDCNPRDGYAISIEKIKEIINHCKYGSPERVMTLMLVLTGCRISELDRMRITGIKGNYIFWKLGKNQSDSRHEYIPDYIKKELYYHKMHYKIRGMQLFSMTHARFRRYFSDLRHNLSESWIKKIDGFSANVIGQQQYDLQIKGFRKTFATFYFHKFLEKYHSPDVAALFVCKKMRHSGKNMTFNHYVEDGERIDVKKWIKYEIWEIFDTDIQKSIID